MAETLHVLLLVTKKIINPTINFASIFKIFFQLPVFSKFCWQKLFTKAESPMHGAASNSVYYN